MTKTIEEAAREYADRPASWKTWGGSRIELEEAFTAGAEYLLSLPLSQRLTDEERERERKGHENTYLLDPDCGVANIPKSYSEPTVIG